jgi:hypothetical protein
MTITANQDVWFDDAATLAMGEAFDHACKSLRKLGSAVPAIIANRILQPPRTASAFPLASMSKH